MNSEKITELTPEDVRREAEGRSRTLDPVSGIVVPDEEPASVQAARHANGPAIANAPNDMEKTTLKKLPEASRRARTNPRPPLSRHAKTAAVTTLVFLGGAVAIIVAYALV